MNTFEESHPWSLCTVRVDGL